MPPSILLLPTTTPPSYTHPCIPFATAALTCLLTAHNLPFTVAPSSSSDLLTFFFSPSNTTTDPDPLAPYTLLLLLHSAGDFLPAPLLPSFRSFLSRGGAVVAIHGAATGMPSWPLYGSVLGGVFKRHPAPALSTVDIVGVGHPVMRDSLGKGKGMRQREGGEWEWEWFDEWYEFETDPREAPGGVEVLISGGGQGAGYPVAWCREAVEGERGRVFYTALGHFEEAYEDEGFMAQVLGAVMWAAGEK
ncbi:trehalose utilization-domain-containing protein [Schizothecium vesticola]|uniref:Trehalose utilization-domain-containing protein n=1 Tax=Schizothecium vesticola TaxID=314040 RepID=A0AA40ELB5_9PEZI|nr:trehalose utilization-domain-containing protein [Schizothecium vesticola]